MRAAQVRFKGWLAEIWVSFLRVWRIVKSKNLVSFAERQTSVCSLSQHVGRAGWTQSKAVRQGHLFSPLTLTESQTIISAEIQLETLSAYASSCWRDRSGGKPSHAGRLLPSAGVDTFLLASQGTDARTKRKLPEVFGLHYLMSFYYWVDMLCWWNFQTKWSKMDLLSELFLLWGVRGVLLF